MVTLELRDVCRDGFGMEAVADAGEYPIAAHVSLPHLGGGGVLPVFLDLPMPWEAIPAAKAAIKVPLFPVSLIDMLK